MTAAPPLRKPPRRTLHGLQAAVGLRAEGEPAWITDWRRAAIDRFAATGLPASNDEEWRFTPLGELAHFSFIPFVSSAPIGTDDVARHLAGVADWPLLVMIDGIVHRELSDIAHLPQGVQLRSLADAVADGCAVVAEHLGHHTTIEATPFAAVNAALMRDGAVLHVAPGVAVATPVRIVHLTTAGAAGTLIAPRLLVVLGEQASATLLESYGDVGVAAPHLTNSCTEVVLAAGARLEHIRLQVESRDGWHVGFTTVDQQRDSHYRSFALALGGRLSRHDLHARLNGSNSETLLYGLYLTRGEQVADSHTVIHHDQPHCNSWEVYKGVLADRSRAVFNGKVLVDARAQKTDAKQTNRNLLLSDEAKVDTKPQLEIFADDVKCTHGATIGRLNDEQRYYLRTRGIAGREAEALLITAFVSEVVVEITQPELRGAVDELVRTTLDLMIGS